MRALTLSVAVLLVLAVAVLLSPPAQADHKAGIPFVYESSVKYGGSAVSASNPIRISDTALYSDVITLVDSCWQSVAWTIAPTTTVSLPIELQWSRDGTNFQAFRTSESWTLTTTETLALQRLSTPVAPYVRFKFGPEASSIPTTCTALYIYRY